MASQEQLAKTIIDHVGGEENVQSLYHCATRLRFTLKDRKKFDKKTLQNTPGILGAVSANEESQVIVGADVAAVYNEIMKSYNISDGSGEITDNSDKNANWFRRLLDVVVGIMAPVATVLIAGGMFKVFLAFCVLFGMNKTGMNYGILNFISDAPFFFLPFMLANSAAKKFHTNPYLAMMMAGVLLHPNFTAMIAKGDPIALFGMPIRLVNYGTSVVPIILIIWFMSYIEHFSERYIPKLVRTILEPLLVVLITAPMALIVIGPLGSFFGDGLFNIISFLNHYAAWFVPTLIGTTFPLLVTVGMHAALTPLATLSFAKYGHENIQGVGAMAATFALASASLAIFFKEKDERQKILLYLPRLQLFPVLLSQRCLQLP